MNALELQGLTKHYKDFTLGPLDLTLPGGTICGLIGENGAGKSTTIRLILDMVQRDGGTVTILGRDSRTASVRTKEEIGVVLGFGECGEGYFRLTAFGDAEKTKMAAERIKTAIKAL